jgi:hypothetical protein
VRDPWWMRYRADEAESFDIAQKFWWSQLRRDSWSGPCVASLESFDDVATTRGRKLNREILLRGQWSKQQRWKSLLLADC